MALALGGAMLCNSACTNLDENLYDRLSKDNIDLSNSKDLSQLLGGAVTQYRYLVTDWGGLWTLSCVSADELMIPKRVEVGWGDLYIPMFKHTWVYSNGCLNGPWTFAYQGISYCNMILDAMGEETDENRQLMSHVRYYRALFYWHLLDNFGNVPIQTTFNTEPGFLPEQGGTEAVYNFIETELTDIVEKIGTEKHFGYGNKYAVEFLLSRLYLNRNALLGTTDNAGYTAALTLLDDIINNGGYSLAPNYKDNFRENIQGSPEVIFAVPQDRTHTSNFIMLTFGFPFEGMKAYGSTASGNSGHCAVPQFVKSYDSEDLRLPATWAMGPQYAAVENPDGTYTLGAGDPISFSIHDWSGTGILNYNIECHSIDNPGCFIQEGYRFHKYEIIAGTDDAATATDIAVFRYAEVLMMKAECLLRTGKDDATAADLVTLVRRRAFSNSSKATVTAAQLKGGSVYEYGHDEYTTDAADANSGCIDWTNHVSTFEGGADIELGGLFDEYGWEFAGEMQRRTHMRRFTLSGGGNVYNRKSYFCKDGNTEDFRDFFPIPEEAMKANIKLVQNPGYTN